jgi:beta-lysine 5,6-aminomutase alpha subunit
MGKLTLDEKLIKRARGAAKEVAISTLDHVNSFTTVSQERTVVRLFGIDGVDAEGIPLANIIVDSLHQAGELSKGVAFYIANAVSYYNTTPQNIATKVSLGELDLLDIPTQDEQDIKMVLDKYTEEALRKISENKEKRESMQETLSIGKTPWQYVIVATGNIYEDIVQAKAAARQGADIIAVIRTTGQSLLDYVPYGATTEGFGGTYATQENFRIMRRALDEVSQELGRYIQLVNYCSGLCMPEIAAIGAFERLDMMLNDSMYGILFRDINMVRTFIDQYFSRMINAYAGVIINTGEDNYLTTADAFEEGHTVIASQFINEQLAFASGLSSKQMGLGHAFEINPDIENSLLYEIAQAQLSRDLFPEANLKYMPPTKYMTGDIFKGHVQDSLFNLTSVLTNQGIHLLGMLTEAIHTPFMQDRALSLQNSMYVMQAARDLSSEIEFKKDGIINNHAQNVLAKACSLLEEIAKIGLETAIEQGMFANIKRKQNAGKGLEGVIQKAESYVNPFLEKMERELGLGGESIE